MSTERSRSPVSGQALSFASDSDGMHDPPTTVTQVDVAAAVHRAARPCVLQQIEGPGAPREFVLDLPELVIGRSVQTQISIDSALLSRRHVVLERRGPEYSCSDLGSSNGMYVNGVRAHSILLRDRDVLQIGDVVLLYREGH